MPIITMLVSIRPSGWDGHSPSASRASITWPTISAGLEVAHQLHRPGRAEAAVERAADLARHAQGAAIGVGDEHHLIIVAVVGLEQPLAGAVGRHLRLDHFGARDHEALGEPAALRLGDVAHRCEVADPAVVDPVPDLLGAQLGLPRLEPAASNSARICSFDRPTSSTRPSARGAAARGTGTGSIAPAIGIRVVSALMANGLSS